MAFLLFIILTGLILGSWYQRWKRKINRWLKTNLLLSCRIQSLVRVKRFGSLTYDDNLEGSWLCGALTGELRDSVTSRRKRPHNRTNKVNGGRQNQEWQGTNATLRLWLWLFSEAAWLLLLTEKGSHPGQNSSRQLDSVPDMRHRSCRRICTHLECSPSVPILHKGL